MTDKKNTPSGRLGASVESSGGPFSVPHFSTNGTGTQAYDIEDIMLAGRPDAAPTPDATQARPVFSPLTLADLLQLPPKQWLLDLIFGAGDLVMLYGPPGTGKTFVAIDMIFSLCLAQQWGERFAVARPLTVAYCAGEGVGGLSQRFQSAAEYYGVDTLPGFSFFTATPQLHTKASTPETIHQFVTDWQARDGGPLDLLVIDTFHSATVGAEENSATDAGIVLQSLKVAQKALGCAVMLLHHTNKNGNAERGSSALRGAMDAMIGIAEAGNKFSMNCEKLKDGAAWQSQTFALVAKAESVRVWWDEPADPAQTNGKQNQDKEALLKVMTDDPGRRFTSNRLSETIGLAGNKQIFKILSELVDAGDCTRELSDPDKQASSRNPWVYFVESVSENE